MIIKDYLTLRPRYNEVDKMGYVYHANYVSYCHQARTELFRKMRICDSTLEAMNIMMPVISFDIKYKKAAHYDESITIETTITTIAAVRIGFNFVIYNSKNEKITTANTEIVFVDATTRQPLRVPQIVKDTLHFASLQSEV